ncbi:MAG: hypothetical protein EOO78_04505 [Oxalobacteraceae bacterium]|nr:MAG: hypothetical protein EOO78_04505 [Oxalobacteraceae bacterium]
MRGFRIELGEIEARLLACGGVREAVVVARRDGDAADPRLVAYLIAQDGAALEPAALRSALLAGLADYMVPSAYVVLDAFPLTPNNKIDRNALPAPDGDAVVKRAYAAPQGEVETAIAAIWQELLHLEQVGRDDDFFALGGHSLLAVQLAGRIREQCHVDAALKDMFNRPVLHQMAELVTSLQFSIFMGAQQDQLRGDLDTLSEEELLKLLEEESLSDD